MRSLSRMSVSPASSIILGFAALVALLPGVRAGTDPLSTEMLAVFARDASAIVKIEAEEDSGPLSGTGFFVDSNGTILTNYSVGGESRDIFVSFGGIRYPAFRIAADSRSGLAILKLGPPNLLSSDQATAETTGTLPMQTPYLPLGKAGDLGTASVVMTIGYPLDLPVTPSIGCVGGFSVSYGDQCFAVSHIRTSVPAQRGEGGAPLLNMNGEVVGILESSLDEGAGCFALPIEAAEKVHSDFVRFGEPRPGWLGIRFDKSDVSEGPVTVQGCVDDSPAQKAGFQRGDVILQIGDRKVVTADDVINAAFYLTVGEEVPLTVSRGGQTMEIKVVPEISPLSPQDRPVFNISAVTGSNVLFRLLAK